MCVCGVCMCVCGVYVCVCGVCMWCVCVCVWCVYVCVCGVYVCVCVYVCWAIFQVVKRSQSIYRLSKYINLQLIFGGETYRNGFCQKLGVETSCILAK